MRCLSVAEEETKEYKAYCVKCKKKDVPMQNPEVVVNARGMKMAKGKCPVCGTTMCRILGKA